jgi:hypothetical protein
VADQTKRYVMEDVEAVPFVLAALGALAVVMDDAGMKEWGEWGIDTMERVGAAFSTMPPAAFRSWGMEVQRLLLEAEQIKQGWKADKP